MKKIIILTAIIFISTTRTYAHLAGQQPFFKINGQYANLYSVPLTSLYNFDLPQDSASENYLVNQTINFELDKNRLPAPAAVIEKTKFNWDFTDGEHSQGLTVQHKFSKVGSYIIKIYADDATTPKPQLIESTLINIIPSKDYSLPQAKIVINGQSSKDPLTDILKGDFKNEFQLDGSTSSSSNKIEEYFWDFGDQKSATGSNTTHLYSQDLSQVFVVLRVKDSQGFIADNFVELLNEQNKSQASPLPSRSTSKPNQFPFALLGFFIFFGIIFMARWLFLVRYRGKHQ